MITHRRQDHLPRLVLAFSLGVSLAVLSGSGIARAAGCPGTGDCCQANLTPGCENQACCEEICGLDPFCCTNWDASCASEARTLCGVGVCSTSACPGPGDCCADNGTPGCDDTPCCELVCADDAFCCTGNWDENCAEIALALCDASSCSGATCAGIGDCCAGNGTPSCEEESCCSQVCAQDPICCSTVWDAECVTLARQLCGSLCPDITVCGDGVREGDEACDDGNTDDGDCCDANCAVEVAGSPCPTDGNQCTTDVCDGAGTCTHLAVPDDTPCTDGLACSIDDACASGTCVGIPLLPGDTDADCETGIVELQSCIAMFLSLSPCHPCSDSDVSGTCDVVDLQSCIAAFLTLLTCP